MNATPPKPQPRFIPTLTEVVDPALLQPGVMKKQTSLQNIVSQVMVQVRPLTEQYFRQMTEQWVQQQWLEHQANWDSALAELVQQVVMRELAQVGTRTTGVD